MIALRRASLDDVDWLVDLLNGEETEPFLGGGAARDRNGVRAQVERSLHEPELAGTMIVEVDGERAGTMKFELALLGRPGVRVVAWERAARAPLSVGHVLGSPDSWRPDISSSGASSRREPGDMSS